MALANHHVTLNSRIALATLDDIDALLRLEQASFDSDCLSRRSFRRHIQSSSSSLLLVKAEAGDCLAYGLVLYHQGTRLSRLYSLAVDQRCRGQGLAQQLLERLEQEAADKQRHYMRLEVAKHNSGAIALYEKCGYRVFGERLDYYQDHSDALRMQKKIRSPRAPIVSRETPWYRQSTDFTCGPAALLMAMASIARDPHCSLEQELDIWREATTIYMTSGHGGCHPLGLALAAHRRGFEAQVWLNLSAPLFIDGVRTEHKKHIVETVHHQFVAQCQDNDITLFEDAICLAQIRQHLSDGYAMLMLVSTYRLDGKKAPHWVVVTGMDRDCLFVHDPDLDEDHWTPLDCQYIPIAHEDFEKMAVFGSQRLRAAIAIRQRASNNHCAGLVVPCGDK